LVFTCFNTRILWFEAYEPKSILRDFNVLCTIHGFVRHIPGYLSFSKKQLVIEEFVFVLSLNRSIQPIQLLK